MSRHSDEASTRESLEFTGERFLPDCRGDMWLEHWHRYHFAASMVTGARVLDVASGEGYGAALLARSAAQVCGLDRSSEAIAHARARYVGVHNLAFVHGDCARLPFAQAVFDRVVSFETIEHIEAQEGFLAEIARVLRPDGVLLVSSPNRLEYSDRRGYVNEFHVRELYRDELAALAARHFSHLRWYGQWLTYCSLIWPLAEPAAASQAGIAGRDAPGGAHPGMGEPLYFVLACAREAASLAALPSTLSAFADREDFLRTDYGIQLRNLELQFERNGALEREIRALTEHAARLEDALARSEATLGAVQAEHARRSGLRGWLAAPWRWISGWMEGGR